MVDKVVQVLGTSLISQNTMPVIVFEGENMISAVIIVVVLLVLATALEKEVMRKVRKYRFQKTLTEAGLPNFKSGGD